MILARSDLTRSVTVVLAAVGLCSGPFPVTPAHADGLAEWGHRNGGPSPTAEFTANVTLGNAPLTVAFTDLSSDNGSPITAWSWSFGDTATSDERHPNHTYTAAGSYEVSLTVTTAGGDATETKTAFVNVADTSDPVTGPIDLSNAIVVTNPAPFPKAEAMAATVLVDEIEKRTGLAWPTTTEWPGAGTIIALTARVDAGSGLDPEGYRLFVQAGNPEPTVVWVIGADPRGALYGVGKLLRTVEWSAGQAILPEAPNVVTAPVYPLRGHQLGYRNTANSYDAWDADQYERYIRELIIFGANSIENIPFDGSDSVHFQMSKIEMALAVSAICDDYGVEHWVWTPAPNLFDATARAAALDQHEELYRQCVRIDAVFVPGGDPGSNPPEVVMLFLEDLAARLANHHPGAGVWVSNQGFEHEENDWFFDYLKDEEPPWLAGVVYGPWTKLSLAEQRARTPDAYPIRRYPDITHNVRCQYPVPAWDRAFAHTLGREASNPRPVDTAHIHNVFASLSTGFLAYSDGVHDDVNKVVWAQRGWDPGLAVDEIVRDYARFFFGPDVADDAVDGIFALEQNWVGPLADNSGVDDTLTLWGNLETQASGLAGNWRWQLCLLRAYYDAYTRHRLLHETNLEQQANALLGDAEIRGANAATEDAEAVLALAGTAPARPDLRTRIVGLCEELFLSIGLQTSVNPPYSARSSERGCVLDFVDHPLNNRWWLETVFTGLRAVGTEDEKLEAIDAILGWEDPGPGGSYDDLGDGARQSHLVQSETWMEDPGRVESAQEEFGWHNGDRALEKGGGRLTWQDQAQTLYGSPLLMRYDGLNPGAAYTLRAMYLGRFRATMTLTADDQHAIHGPLAAGSLVPHEFAIPRAATADGVLELSWDLVEKRGCQVAEVWLLCDACPDDPNKVDPGQCGCGNADTDTDDDGVADCNDLCPLDPDKVDPGVCDCGSPDVDTDGDTVLDCLDGCPDDPLKTEPGDCGCGVVDSDADADDDGVLECVDGCPNDPDKADPGACGCGIPDTDSDGDGKPDCRDQCPDDPDKMRPGDCGCGQPERPGCGDEPGDDAVDAVLASRIVSECVPNAALLRVEFDAGDSVAPGGATYDWDFGDGSALADGPAIVVHDYTSTGAIKATVTVRDGTGASDIAAKTIAVSSCPVPDDAVRVSPLQGPAPLVVTFDATAVLGATSFEWNFGLGAPGTGRVVRHTFTHPGGYEVHLLATDDAGRIVLDRTLPMILVTGEAARIAPPQAGIAIDPAQGEAPLQVQFSAAGSTDPDNEIVDYVWDFGDGTAPDRRMTGDHVFGAPGTYEVALTVTDATGQTDRATTTVLVLPVSLPPASSADVLPEPTESDPLSLIASLLGNCGLGTLMALATSLLGLAGMKTGFRSHRR